MFNVSLNAVFVISEAVIITQDRWSLTLGQPIMDYLLNKSDTFDVVIDSYVLVYSVSLVIVAIRIFFHM